MFENSRRGRQARNFTTNAPKILDLKSSSEQIFSRKLPLGAPEAASESISGLTGLLCVRVFSTLIYLLPKSKKHPGCPLKIHVTLHL